jgi:nuclear pore complex protein Nup62
MAGIPFNLAGFDPNLAGNLSHFAPIYNGKDSYRFVIHESALQHEGATPGQTPATRTSHLNSAHYDTFAAEFPPPKSPKVSTKKRRDLVVKIPGINGELEYVADAVSKGCGMSLSSGCEHELRSRSSCSNSGVRVSMLCICMYVCVCICMYVNMDWGIRACADGRVRVSVYVCMCVYMYVCVHICMYVCMYMYVCVHICMDVCMYVCMLHINVCMYVCTALISSTNWHPTA